MESSDRIDGWKAIGAHFGRDRTTAMRWAQSRALPVRRIPGGKRATVYALRSDLDRWAVGHADEIAQSTDATTPGRHSASTAKPGRSRWIGGAVAMLIVGTVAGGWMLDRSGDRGGSTPTVSAALPGDVGLARLYLQARDDWAERTPDSLTRAIRGLETVTTRDPQFAPAFAALADAHLLQREFGAVADAPAFAAARTAAAAALAVDQDQIGAHRALGFIQYWSDNDPVASGRSFRRALELSPDSAQTHFWYGNVLADNGQAEAAARELNRARLLEPGSIAVQVDIAWADWSAGRENEAVITLERLVQMKPEFPVIHDCLAIMRLSRGDYRGYVEAYGDYARLRADPVLLANAQRLEDGLALGLPVLKQRIMSAARAEAAAKGSGNYAWPAFVASIDGDRPTVVDILTQAAERNLRWGSAGLRREIARRWASDAQILGLLDRVEPRAVE